MSFIDLMTKFAGHVPVVGKEVNRLAINHFAGTTTPRPRPFSLWSAETLLDPKLPEYVTDYTSWPSLTNRQYSGRHLGPADLNYIASLPPEQPYGVPADNKTVGKVTSLFVRPPGR